MYQGYYTTMPPACWYFMMQGMPAMGCPMIMPEVEEKIEKKHKRDDAEIFDEARGGVEKPCAPEKPCVPEKPYTIPKPVMPVPTPVTNIKVETEQSLTNILNIIEIEAPDIINTLITLGLSLEAARQLIKAIVKISHKHYIKDDI